MDVIDLRSRTHFSPTKPQKDLVADSPEARMVLFCLEPGQEIPPHTSTSTVSLTVVEGEGVLQGIGEGTPLRAGTFVAYAPEELHGWKATSRLVILATIAPAP